MKRMKTVLITGIGGLTPRSIAKVIRKKHPDYRLIGCDINKRAIGFFINGLLDEYYIYVLGVMNIVIFLGLKKLSKIEI